MLGIRKKTRDRLKLSFYNQGETGHRPCMFNNANVAKQLQLVLAKKKQLQLAELKPNSDVMLAHPIRASWIMLVRRLN
jgi:hypothetical protein